MLYIILKYIHILSSTILFGTGIGTASVMVYAHQTRDVRVMSAVYRYVVKADWLFTLSSAVIQPITGIWMVLVAGYSFFSFWVLSSIIGYCIAAFCWFPVVYLQIKMRDMAALAESFSQLPKQYHQYFKIWFVLGWPAFISLMIVFYLMTAKPSLSLIFY